MNVEHDKQQRRFSIRLGAYEACLMYARRGNLLDFYHIYVPDPFRNRGIAGKILIEAFEYAKANGLKVVPSCPFITSDFLPRFGQYRSIVHEGAFPFTRRGDSHPPM